MRLLLRLSKEAARYKLLLIIAVAATFLLTVVNLTAPKILAKMTGLVSSGLNDESMKDIAAMAVVLLLLYSAKILFRFLSNYMAHKAAWWLVRDIRVKVYNIMQSFSIDFYHDRQTGELMSRVISDTANFEQLYAHLLPESVTNTVTLAGVTILLFTINAKLALLTCIPIPFILLSGWFFVKKVRPNFRKTQKVLGELSAQLQDSFSGMQEIQAFGQQKRASGQVAEKADGYTMSVLRALRLSAVFHPTVEFLTGLGTVIVVGFGGYFAYKDPTLGVEDIVSFLLYLALFYAPITGIAQLFENSQQALAGAERVIEIIDTPVRIKDSESAKDITNVKGNIIFDNVNFSYIEDVPVLVDVSFEIKPGQMVALVGATGVGKSTITQLMSRFYEPVSGSIYLDGQNLRDITLESLRNNISVVLQDTFLFNGSIAENIAFAAAESDIDEIEAAARIARIHDDIMEMPDGYNTQVGERGVKLSGGQKQRIAIARAVLCKAPILILDEATASVDVKTEAKIQQAINEIAGTRTIVAIAHRLSTIKNADIIFVFEHGKIVQKGTHDELMTVDGLYKSMNS